MPNESLEDIARDLATRAKARGCRGAIVAVSRDMPDGDHSLYHVETIGPCLEVEGLAARVTSYVSKIWEGLTYHRDRQPQSKP